MNELAQAVCELMGWADSESLRARVLRHATLLAQEFSLEPHRPDRWRYTPGFVRLLAERCAVNETYFFRHREQLEAGCAELRRAFPTGPLTVWSAACSTGEEAWSLAMLLLDGGVELERLSVLGTDCGELPLKQAREASYPEWSFRGVPPELRARRFVPEEGGRVRVAERYRPVVTFTAHNLLTAPPLLRAHLVSCRNVLIYLRPDAARAVVEALVRVLAPGGLLLLGTAEETFAQGLGLEPVLVGGVVLHRKPPSGQRAAPAPVMSAPQPKPTPVLPPPRPSAPAPPVVEPLEAAWEALRAGDTARARALAQPAAAQQEAEAHLVLALIEDAAGEAHEALEHLRRALYLDPSLVLAHVSQATLYGRLGREKDAGRARSNALRHLRALDDETVLRAVTPVSVRELKKALEVS